MRKKVKEMKRQYKMAPGKVLVHRDSAPKMSASGAIHIPDTATGTEFTGVVIAVGPGLDPGQVKVGDKLLYGNMYSMLNTKGHDAGTIVLKYPEEVMYVFSDSEVERDETDEEMAEREASEERRLQLLAGGKLATV